MILLNDRLMRGAVAGMLGGLFVNAVGLPSYFLLHFPKSLWVIQLSWMVRHLPPKSTIDWILAFFIFYLFCGLLGAIYSAIAIPQPGSGNYIFRGLVVSIATWMLVSTFSIFFNVPIFEFTAWQTTITFLIQVTVWGVVVGILMRRWDKKKVKY